MSLAERLKAGFLFGGMWSAFVPLILLIAFVQGDWIIDMGRASEMMVHFGILAVGYPVGALATGLLLFSLAPVLPGLPLKMLWGSIAFLPWFGAVFFATDYGWEEWTRMHTGLTLFLSLFMGCVSGWAVSKELRLSRAKRQKRGT